MTKELTIQNPGEVADRAKREALLQVLEHGALAATTPEEAADAMHRAALIKDALERAKQPYEDAWRAGKASVLAARKLGSLMGELSSETVSLGRRGRGLSERGIVRQELGLTETLVLDLMRIAKIADPDFQRYIQSSERIPSVHGAMTACRIKVRQSGSKKGDWRATRRKQIGVKSPANPSLDEAGSLIVKALGHLGSAKGGGPKNMTARSQAMDLLYQAHDLIRPYLGGYVE